MKLRSFNSVCAAFLCLSLTIATCVDDAHAQRRRRQNLCLQSDGDIVTKARCRANRGESALDSAGMTSIADSAIAGVPQGLTISGVFGGQFTAAGVGSWGTSTTFPGFIIELVEDGDIEVVATTELLSECQNDETNCLADDQVANDTRCPGSVAAPLSTPGVLCIYPSALANASEIDAAPIPAAGTHRGFAVTWNSTAASPTSVFGTWSYTAAVTAPQPGQPGQGGDNDDDNNNNSGNRRPGRR